MRLPFTNQEFFDVLATFNAACWPVGVSADYALPVAGAALAMYALQHPTASRASAAASPRL